jgi:uncharacterized protein
MRSNLDHLPVRQRNELGRILEIIFAEFAEAFKNKQSPSKKAWRILKVVLFGSYARGGWVDDRLSGYKSDFDILVVVNDAAAADPEYWYWTDERLVQELTVFRRIGREANVIVHALSEVNDQLSRGRYFFTDIVSDGIVLYEAPGHPFATPKELSTQEAYDEAQMFFDECYPSAQNLLRGARFFLSDGSPKEAAFTLHQVVERLYNCILLVFTLYSPASHNIKHLRSLAEDLDPRLIGAWPRKGRFAKRSFERLKRAYVEARYSRHYVITAEELAWLVERIDALQETIRIVCEEKLAARQAGP